MHAVHSTDPGLGVEFVGKTTVTMVTYFTTGAAVVVNGGVVVKHDPEEFPPHPSSRNPFRHTVQALQDEPFP